VALFYLTTINCQFPLLLNCACRQLIEWANINTTNEKTGSGNW